MSCKEGASCNATDRAKGASARTYHQDYDNGVRSEKECHPFIEAYLKQTISPTENRYSEFDWVNDTTLAELKTRSSIYRERYPTTYVNKSKWDFGLTSDSHAYFFVRFSDGLFVYKQDASDEFEIEHVRNANRDRYTRGNPCVCIPVERLEFVANVPPPSNEVRLD